jgi:hypothetical protein
MMLTIGLSYIAFITLRNVPSVPCFFRAFIIKGCWILWNAFSASIAVMMWFSFLILFMHCIASTYLKILYHPCIPGMKPTRSWCISM